MSKDYFSLKISIVTPTYSRSDYFEDYFASISTNAQYVFEIIIVDSSPDDLTKQAILKSDYFSLLPVHYEKTDKRGTAIQRNIGIEIALKNEPDFLLFLDDDVRIDKGFIHEILYLFEHHPLAAAITGYRKNCAFELMTRKRFKYYQRFGLLKRVRSGVYDSTTGYPINIDGAKNFEDFREVEFCSTACSMMRAHFFREGLRFDVFFEDYGMLEDLHLSHQLFLRGYKIFQSKKASCIDLRGASDLKKSHIRGLKTAVNFYWVFQNLYGPLSFKQKLRFLNYQFFEVFKQIVLVLKTQNREAFSYLVGKVKGVLIVILWKFSRYARN